MAGVGSGRRPCESFEMAESRLFAAVATRKLSPKPGRTTWRVGAIPMRRLRLSQGESANCLCAVLSLVRTPLSITKLDGPHPDALQTRARLQLATAKIQTSRAKAAPEGNLSSHSQRLLNKCRQMLLVRSAVGRLARAISLSTGVLVLAPAVRLLELDQRPAGCRSSHWCNQNVAI